MRGVTKTLLACGVIATPLFVLTFLIEGALRPEYLSLRHPVSSLSIGKDGWIQVTNFIISGSLIFLFALGMRRAVRNSEKMLWAPRLIALVGMGLIGAGICTSDPIYGYPMNLPMKLAQFTIQGHLHDFFSIFVFMCQPLTCFKFGRLFASRHKKGWATYCYANGIAMLIIFILAGAAFKQTPVILEWAGLFQRLCIILGGIWMTSIATHLILNREKF